MKMFVYICPSAMMTPFNVNRVSVGSLRNAERLAQSAFVVDTLGVIKAQLPQNLNRDTLKSDTAFHDAGGIPIAANRHGGVAVGCLSDFTTGVYGDCYPALSLGISEIF